MYSVISQKSATDKATHYYVKTGHSVCRYSSISYFRSMENLCFCVNRYFNHQTLQITNHICKELDMQVLYTFETLDEFRENYPEYFI